MRCGSKCAARRGLHLAKMERSPPRRTPLQTKCRNLFGSGRVVVAGAGIGRSSSGPAAGSALLLFAGFANERFAREANLVALDREHLNKDLVAKFQLIANVADAMLGDFTDVQEAVGAGEKLDEGAKFGEAHDFAKIRFADFGAGGDVADHLQGRIAAGSAGGEDVHRAVLEDVDFDAGGFDDGADL